MRFPKKLKVMMAHGIPQRTLKPHRRMKYKTSTTATMSWKQDNILLDFLSEIKRKILDKICPDQKCIIGRYNLLKNTGEIIHDQMPYRDY